MASNDFKCNYLTPLHFQGLIHTVPLSVHCHYVQTVIMCCANLQHIYFERNCFVCCVTSVVCDSDSEASAKMVCLFFTQIRPEQALAAAEARMELHELNVWKDNLLSVVEQPREEFK